FGNFFQLASNCIINLQATVESFANRVIPDDYPFEDTNGTTFYPSIIDKLNIALPEIKGKRFRTKFKKDNYTVRQIIELRNAIVHLKPAEDTNTGYKILYRKLISFNYAKAISAVRNFINF